VWLLQDLFHGALCFAVFLREERVACLRILELHLNSIFFESACWGVELVFMGSARLFGVELWFTFDSAKSNRLCSCCLSVMTLFDFGSLALSSRFKLRGELRNQILLLKVVEAGSLCQNGHMRVMIAYCSKLNYGFLQCIRVLWSLFPFFF